MIAEAVALRAKYKSAEQLALQVTEGVTASSTETDIIQEQAQPRTEEVQKLAPTEIAQDESQQPGDDAMPQGGLLEEIAPQEASELLDEVTIVQREFEQYLEEQATQIAVLPEGSVLAGEDETEIQWLLNASLDSVKQVIRSVPVRSAYRTLYLLNQFQSGDTKRMELLEQRVTQHHVAIGAAEPTAEPSTDLNDSQPASEETMDTCESEYSEPFEEQDDLVEPEEDAFELEPEPQVFQEGSSVEIVSDRHGDDLIWQVGVIKVANAVGCVVEVSGKTVWFCVDELVLVSTTPQAAPEQQKDATRGTQGTRVGIS